jgi:transcriptional regulator with XRE-family HTH domain
MNDDTIKAFARRLREICEDMGLPSERGLQTRLAREFKVSPNAARKWLLGEGMPELDLAIEIANWANVSVLWLLQGTGPKRGNTVETKSLVLDEVFAQLPGEDEMQVVDYIRYKIERGGRHIASERLHRYTTALDAYARDAEKKQQDGH